MRHAITRKLCVLFVIVGLLVPVVALPATAGAVNVFQACNGNGGTNNGAGAGNSDVCKQNKSTGTNPVITVLKVALNIISIVVGVAAVIILIIAGIKFITASGDPSNVRNARDTIVFAFAGLMVVVLAQAIVGLVLDRLQ